MTTAAAREIRTEPTVPESQWRAWLARYAPLPLAAADLPGAAQRLVVVSPHPDDEVLACGGLLASHAARGGPVAVIAVTDGEASHRGDPEWPDERLAALRRDERLRGLAQLGIGASAVTRLGFADGALAADRAGLLRALHAALRADDLVVATWALDGHPDHDAIGAAAALACTERGCRLLQAPVWMWQWSRPRDVRVPWHRLRALELPAALRERKNAALAEHTSQLSPRAGALGPVLGAAILARAQRHAEYFFIRR